jgi:hypothetical protein
MTSTTRRLLLLLAPAALTVTAACNGSDFTPISRLEKLRVLAVRAEPVNPAEGATTTLESLVYVTPSQPASASTYAWTWCPILGNSADGYTCPFTDAEVAMLATQLGATKAPPPLAFSTEEKPTFENVFPAASLATVCANGFGDFKLDCENGYPIRVKVTVTNGGESVVATAVVRLPIDATPSNVNPVIDGLELLLAGGAQTVDEAGTVELPRLVETVFHAKVDDAQSESFMGKDDSGEPATVRERLVLSWYSEMGDLESTQTAYIPGKSEIVRLTDNKIEARTKEDDPADTSRVIVVLRDNRGGVSWTTGVVQLGAL